MDRCGQCSRDSRRRGSLQTYAGLSGDKASSARARGRLTATKLSLLALGRRPIEVKLIPHQVPASHLHLTVVLQGFEVALGALVAFELIDRAVEHFDGLIALATLPHAVGINVPEEALLLIGEHRLLEDRLHLVEALALVEQGAKHRAGYPVALKRALEEGLGLIETLAHVEHRADLAVDLGGD